MSNINTENFKSRLHLAIDMLLVVLLALKITHLTDMEWKWVLAPLWAPILFVFVLSVMITVIQSIESLDKKGPR